LIQAIQLIITRDPALMQIVAVSLRVTGTALLFSTLIGIPLGATKWQATLAVLMEARLGVIVSIIAGFGSIISEVEAVMMIGGNIPTLTLAWA
jgi:ABC-type tungstate transport system substrate-binding protein